MKKALLSILILSLILNCADLERDNIFDPKNPQSYVDQKILVELFVNDSTGFEYCDKALEAIEQISQETAYQNQILILEYHLTKEGWNDPFASEENLLYYHDYVPDQEERGIPDAFFNGLMRRVQGASAQKVGDRYREAIDELSGKKAYFRVEAVKDIANEMLNLNIKLARLGGYSKTDIRLNVVLYEDMGFSRHRFVVRKILDSQRIHSINPGEVRSFSYLEQLENITDLNAVNALIFIQDDSNDSKEVYYVTKI